MFPLCVNWESGLDFGVQNVLQDQMKFLVRKNAEKEPTTITYSAAASVYMCLTWYVC